MIRSSRDLLARGFLPFCFRPARLVADRSPSISTESQSLRPSLVRACQPSFPLRKQSLLPRSSQSLFSTSIALCTMEDPSSHLSKRFGTLLQTSFNPAAYEAVSSLSPEERVLAYYLYRAAVSGYRIALFQMCPHPRVIEEVNKLALALYQKKDESEELRILSEEVEAWWVYLFSNYGVHCERESVSNKKTPELLGLPHITRKVVEEHGLDLTEEEWKYLFDFDYFPTATVPSDIEQSGRGFFPPGYKNDTYAKLSTDDKDCLIAYHTEKGMRRYAVGDVCGEYLADVVHWLTLARDWAAAHEQVAGPEMVGSLDPLIAHLRSGDEEDFKTHSRVWLKLKNKIEYCLGFIEYYDDPMGHVGTFQADVTVKQADISPLLELLPTFEKQFPFPEQYKRKDMSNLPNAAPAHKIVGIGGLGPTFCTLAYCLPNYQDIRSELGSKQIMYPAPAPSDIPRYMQVFCSQAEREIHEKYSPDLQLHDTVAALTTTLHETIGHASGSMAEGMTEKIRNERLGKYGNGLEEMRAEVLAMYTAIRFYDDIVKSNFMGDWPQKVPKEDILKLVIIDVAGSGWKRWRGLPKGTTAITQAHALADTGIMYYLIEHSNGEVKLFEEEAVVQEKDGNTKTIPTLRFHVGNVDKVFPVIEELATTVQHMSSTAIESEVTAFMEKYAASTRDPRYAEIVTTMRDVASHGVIETVNVFPEMALLRNADGKVVDAVVTAPTDPVNHMRTLYRLSAAGADTK